MQKHLFLLVAGLSIPALMLGIAASGCGDVIVIPPDEDGGVGGGDARHDSKTTASGPDTGEAGPDVLPDYIDPGCADAGPPATQFECDPYNQSNSGCQSGKGCFIWVGYPPPGDVCGQEIYGASCAVGGPGKQGDGCGGATDCGGGFVCVVSGSGNQCVQLCKLNGDDGCPAGLVCEPIDVEGFGGCL